METKKFSTRPTKKPKQSIGITFQVTPEFREELQHYADLDDRPLGQFVKTVLKNYIKIQKLESEN